MTQRSPEDYERAAFERRISFIPCHKCSLCGESVGWEVHEGGVAFDSSCGCSWSAPRLSSWDEVAEHFNRNQPERNERIKQTWLDEQDVFWGWVAQEDQAPCNDECEFAGCMDCAGTCAGGISTCRAPKYGREWHPTHGLAREGD